jgi:NADP-dependent 3-hydroxy acid dehydrogenase YdfG
MDTISVEGQPVLLITGASSGMGAATARAAAALGFRLALAARREEPLHALADELGGPEKAIAIRCDVTDWDDQQAAVATAIDAFGSLDAVFANAGMHSMPGWKAEPVEQWREMILTNVYGAALTARAAYDALIASQGRLLLTSSRAAKWPIAGSLYGCAKSAVTAMGEALRLEFNGTGVQVCVIHPGWVGTPMVADIELPDGILVPEDIARAAAFVLTQPKGVDISEMLVRPTVQPT